MTEAGDKARRIEAALTAALQSDAPLIVGPWIGEVGYELLYWIPFVRWALTSRAVSSRPVIVVSRGGVSSWYGGLGMDRYVDAFELMTPAELRALSGGGKPKQSATAGDPAGDELVRRVQALCGLREVSRLLPHWMYRLYRPYWDGDDSIDSVSARADWSRIVPPPALALADSWPRNFVAVRFYFSRSFPQNETNIRFARSLLDTLAAHLPMVLLNHGFSIDDHRDYEPSAGQVRSIAHLMTPSTNLAMQTAVIGRAAAFVGTYGGLSMLPSVCGVPSYAYHSVPFTKAVHETAIRCMIDGAHGAPLRVGYTSDGTAEARRILADVRESRGVDG